MLPTPLQDDSTSSIPLACAKVEGTERIRLMRLIQKIPHEVQGVFGVIITHGHLTGLELLANPVTSVLNRMATASGGEAREQAVHSRGQTTRWEGEVFEKMLADPFSHFVAAKNTHTLIPYSRTKKDQAAELATEQGLAYEHSTTLSQLLCHPKLSKADQQHLRNVAKWVPQNLRGTFCCDVAKAADGSLVVSAIGLDPNQLTNRTALELLPAILTPDQSFLREPAQRAGIRPHNYAFMLPREQFLKLADTHPERTLDRA